MRRLLLVVLLLCTGCNVAAQPFMSPQAYLPVMVRQPTPTPIPVRGAGSTYDRCEALQLAGATWYYDWGPHPALCEGVEAVPMIWGRGINVEIGGNSQWLLGFNEPELSTQTTSGLAPEIKLQANITPTLAAELWREIEILHPDKKLVSPATVFLVWLTTWWNEYQRLYGAIPRVDAVAIHCWQQMTAREAANLCRRQVTQARAWANERGISEVWCTEWYQFSCFPEGMEGSVAYLEEMLPWLETHADRHAWFQVMDSANWFGPYCETDLVQDGALTQLGQSYAEYPATK